jgi:Zn-finger nucleic acid-binding protein
MTGQSVGDAEVDVCGACGGIWVDWFDGEVREVASRVAESGVATSGRASDPGMSHNEAHAIGACPRCTRQLVAERYVAKTIVTGAKGHKRTETVTGAELMRCEDCSGAFVSRTSLEVLASLSPEIEEPPASDKPSAAEPMLWDRLAAIVRGLLGRGGS